MEVSLKCTTLAAVTRVKTSSREDTAVVRHVLALVFGLGSSLNISQERRRVLVSCHALASIPCQHIRPCQINAELCWHASNGTCYGADLISWALRSVRRCVPRDPVLHENARRYVESMRLMR